MGVGRVRSREEVEGGMTVMLMGAEELAKLGAVVMLTGVEVRTLVAVMAFLGEEGKLQVEEMNQGVEGWQVGVGKTDLQVEG